MSFAPKKEGRGKSPESHKKSTATIQESPLSIQGRNTSIDNIYTNRLDVLEAHLSRISNQQDALLPLMGMLDMAPNVNKNDNLLKSLQKKSQETDEKILKMEQLLKGYQSNVEASLQKIANVPKMPNFDAGLFERNIKMINGQVNEHQNTIKNIENNFLAFQQSIEARIDDEADNTLKVMESKLEKQRQEFTVAINELKKTINETLKKLDEALKEFYLRSERYDEFIQNNNRQRTLEEIQELIAAKFQEQFEFFRDKYDRDLDNLYREFGILRSEMDITNDEKRQAKMAPHIQSLPKDAAPTEKKIKINNLEQALNIYELEKFNKDNTQRIMYELQAFDEKLDNLKSRYLALKAKNKTADPNRADLGDEINKLREEMEIVNEKYIGLKYQIEGAYRNHFGLYNSLSKKKYFFDMRKIEEKMEKLNQIKKEAQEELVSNNKLKRTVPQEIQVIDTFPEKVKNLMDAININLDTTFNRLEIVEDKIKENQDLILSRKK